MAKENAPFGKWWEGEQLVDLGEMLSESKAKMDSGYFEATAKLELKKDEYDEKIKAAYGFKDLPNYAKKAFKPFIETADIQSIFERKAAKISEKLGNKKITKAEAIKETNNLLKRYLLRLETKVEIEITRIECMHALMKQYDEEFKKAKKLLTDRWKGHKTFDKDRVEYLREAYLHRWYEKYSDAILELKPPAKVKLLKAQITGGKFTSGNINKDLKQAYKEMYKTIDLWKKEGSESTKAYKKVQGTFKMVNWDAFEITFDRREIRGEDVRVGPLPDGSEFTDERKNVFPPGAKNLAASLQPPKKKTFKQKVKAKAKSALKSGFAGLTRLGSWARKRVKSATPALKKVYRRVERETVKIKKKTAEEIRKTPKKAAEIYKAARKKLEKLRKDANYTKDVKEAYKASVKKAGQLAQDAKEKAKYAGVKSKAAYKAGAIELGKLKADAEAQMKNTNVRAKIKAIGDQLERATAAIASRLGLKSKPGLELGKEATSKLGKTVYAKINYLKAQLEKKRGGAKHEDAMLVSKYRIVYHKLQRATREYRSAMNEGDLAKRKAKFNKINNEIDREAKANKITFPKSIFAGIATTAPKPKPVAVPQVDVEKVNTTEIAKFVDKKIKYLEDLLEKKRKAHPMNPSHDTAMAASPEYKKAYETIQKAKKEYAKAMKETDPAKKKQKLLNLNTLMDKQAKANKISFPAYLRVPPKAAPKAAPKARTAAKAKPRTPETQGPNPTVDKIEFKKAGQIDVTGSDLPEGTIKLNVSKLRADLINGMAINSDKINKITFSRDNMNEKIAESILNGIKDAKLRIEIAKKLKNKPDELIKVLKLSNKPTIHIVGRASMDGRFGYNMDLAMRRAENAKEQIIKHNKGIETVATFVTVAEVVDVNGNKVTNINTAWEAFTKKFNLGFKEQLTVAQMKVMVNRYALSPGSIKDAQKRRFFSSKLDHVRGVQLQVVKPKDAPKQIAINMKNTKKRTS